MTPPKRIKILSDGNEIEFREVTKDKMYLYVYVKSVTKLGMEVKYSEQDLERLIKTNTPYDKRPSQSSNPNGTT